MKGKILDYSIQNSSGIISGEDGNRYEFSNEEWKSNKAPKVNQKVDFEADDKIAKGIYLETSNVPFDSDDLKSKFSDVADSDIVKNSPLSWYFTVLKKYLVFNGRATRSEYWYYGLFNSIIILVLAFIPILDILYILATFLPSIAVSIRRLHDIGKSGWWLLINLIPIVGPLVLLYFTVLDSKEDNKYGVNPKVATA